MLKDGQWVDLVAPTEKDQVLKCMADITSEINRFGKQGGLTPEGGAALELAVRDLDAKIRAQDEVIKSTSRVLAAGDSRGYGNLAKFAKRLAVPDDFAGCDQTYYNLMVLSPEEAQHVAHLQGRRAVEHQIDVFGSSFLRELQELNDEIYLDDMIRCGGGKTRYAERTPNPAERMKQHPKWKMYASMVNAFMRALDEATTAEGKEWVPTLLSNRLVELIQPELRVSGLFQHIAMGSQNVDLPVLKADFIASFVGEAIADAATAIPSGDSPAANFSNKVSLIAKKLAAKVLASTEVLEDSVVPLTDVVPRLLAKALGRAIEDSLVNGDTAVGTGSAQDFDLQGVATTDRRAIYDGLRKKALIASMPNIDLATFSIGNLMAIKAAMGTYGVIPSQGVWIVGFKGLIKLMTASESSSIPSAMLTLEKLGPLATVLTGMVGIFMGSPVVLSEFMREDVASTGKNTMAGPNTLTTLLYANRECFTVGDRRTVQVRGSAERYIEMDQVVYVGTWRGDFKEYYSTAAAANKIVGIGRNFS